MVDAQRLIIEESPDMLEGGEQPRRINVFLKEDLVDPRMEERTTPGTKVRIIGVLKEVPVPLQTGAISTRFDIAIEANNITPMEESFTDISVSEEDTKEILELAADPNVFKRLSQSISPSVYGYEDIKESILLQLFGGVKKKKSDGGSTRGDIHLLLVGDPGVAKSVLLKFTSTVAPKGRYVSGKAATAAGLCVAPHSTILTNPGGMNTIQELVEPRLKTKEQYCPGVWKQDNIKDIKIQSLSNNLKLHSQTPESIWKLKTPKKVYEITLSTGKKIEITGNTQLFTIKNGQTFWKKTKELSTDDYIATPKKLMGGTQEKISFIDLFNSNPVIHNIKPFVKELVSKLIKKHGSIRKLSKALNIKENQLYHHWVNPKARGNIKLNDLKKLAGEAKTEYKNKIKEISLYNGKNHLIPSILTKNTLYLAGLIAGDGDIRKTKSDSYSIRLSNNNSTLHKIFRTILTNEFNMHYGITNSTKTRPEATRTHSKILGEALINLGMPESPKSDKLSFPNILLHLKDYLLAEFIAGIYDTDGSIHIRKNQKTGSNCIDFTTCSEKFARQLQLVLLRWGIRATIRERPPTKGIIKGKYVKYIVEIRQTEYMEEFAKQIPLKHPEKKKKLEILLNLTKKPHSNIDPLPETAEKLRTILKRHNIGLKKIRWNKNLSRKGILNILSKLTIKDDEIDKIKIIADSDIYWEKIKSIKEKMPEYDFVYDLTVNNSHNFVVDGVLVHNTAAVVKDEFLRGWSLEAGAMVLSNKGIVCVDEIEKMDEHDRSTMHEAMEQQSVTISKANIHASLRAETSVLAAGNPKMGRFDPYTPIPQQIDISPALLSRFDIIFVIRDIPNQKQDEAVATHVLEEHQQEVIRDIIDPKLFRKYVAYAKQKIKPKLTDEAVKEIKGFYIRLRNQSVSTNSDIKPIPITARQLEGIVRLAEAHAKMRLSTEVTKDDAKKAIALLKASLSQVGYDEETKTFDIDRMTTGITSSKRNKILMVKEILSNLESRLGKLIPEEELRKAIEGKLTNIEFDEAINQLAKAGDVFKPKKGFIQRT